MKVLKAGTPWGKEVECTGAGNGNVGCGAKLLINQGDLYQTASHSYDGSSDYYTTFCCPCCGAETDFKPSSGVKLLGTRPSTETRNRLIKEFNQSHAQPRISGRRITQPIEELVSHRFPIEEIEWN